MTITNLKQGMGVAGNKRRNIGTGTFSASYVTGGEVITPALVGLKRIDIFLIANPLAYNVTYNAVNGTIQAAQAPNTGTGNAPFIEVPATTNLSAVSFTFEAVGT